MAISVRGKNIEVTTALQNAVERHEGKVQRYFDKPIRIQVLLSVVKESQTAEATVHVDGVIIRAVERSEDMYRSIDNVFDKVERQIHKYKTRLARRFKGNERLVDSLQATQAQVQQEEARDEFEVVRHKTFGMKPMTVDEAILQMNLLNHDFFIFLNAATDEVSVIYRREDEKYGLIEAKK
ncbi:MAG: ribosome-associated translation inhibitor RaiA [Veillonellaceae bacterium]|nr:ribosome-associated translation inhibitor RaiA [Veillonellaceae bacterium]